MVLAAQYLILLKPSARFGVRGTEANIRSGSVEAISSTTTVTVVCACVIVVVAVTILVIVSGVDLM